VLLEHIQVHKYFINLDKSDEIPTADAVASWFDNVYKPIADVIEEENILSRFPGRTVSDLYIWMVKYWDGLKRRYGQDYPRKRPSAVIPKNTARPSGKRCGFASPPSAGGSGASSPSGNGLLPVKKTRVHPRLRLYLYMPVTELKSIKDVCGTLEAFVTILGATSEVAGIVSYNGVTVDFFIQILVSLEPSLHPYPNSQSWGHVNYRLIKSQSSVC